jgi:hypothetical protein
LLLKEAIPRVHDPLAINSDGSQIFLITDAGLTVVDLGWVPLTFGNIFPSAGVPGAAVRIRGTGFTPGTAVAFNGVSSTATFLDSSTISAVVPALPAGLSRLTLTNPGEPPYTVEAVFSVK